MVLASTGGVLAAARAARAAGVAGSLSSGLHHAKRDHGQGYCTFNGLALAALTALEEGAQAVLILDFDAHCGGGTHALTVNNPAIRHVDIAVLRYDVYIPTPPSSLDHVAEVASYLPAIRSRLAELGREGTRFDLCLYNAGMDPHEGCREGGLAGITHEVLAERERLVFAWCRERRIPVAFVLAGGYTGSGLDQHELVALHRLTLAEAAAT
jgi:acetoin utilization deacetylase AcuC-like enzyme